MGQALAKRTGVEGPQTLTALGPLLYVGDELMRSYTEFPGGVYFKVNDPRTFRSYVGATRGESQVVFAVPDDPTLDVEDLVPERVLPSVRDVLLG